MAAPPHYSIPVCLLIQRGGEIHDRIHGFVLTIPAAAFQVTSVLPSCHLFERYLYPQLQQWGIHTYLPNGFILRYSDSIEANTRILVDVSQQPFLVGEITRDDGAPGAPRIPLGNRHVRICPILDCIRLDELHAHVELFRPYQDQLPFQSHFQPSLRIQDHQLRNPVPLYNSTVILLINSLLL